MEGEGEREVWLVRKKGRRVPGTVPAMQEILSCLTNVIQKSDCEEE